MLVVADHHYGTANLYKNSVYLYTPFFVEGVNFYVANRPRSPYF